MSPSSPHSTPPSELASPSAGSVAARLLRLVLRRLFYVALIIGRFVRPRLGWFLVTGFLLLIIAIETSALILPRLINAARSDGDVRVSAIAPADAVEQFLRGQQDYDIELVWSALSSDLQTTLATNGATKDMIAAQLERERLSGQRYRSVEYVGGVEIEDGLQMFFYAIDIESPSPERNGTFSFVFTVDRSGKIVRLRM